MVRHFYAYAFKHFNFSLQGLFLTASVEYQSKIITKKVGQPNQL